IVYDVSDSGGPLDFDVDVTASGFAGSLDFDVTNTLDFYWGDVSTVTEFEALDPKMVLPRDGMGLDIDAGDGDDLVEAGAGDDLVYGGAGIDTIYGGTGDDTLYGQGGNDALYGEAGNDTLIGGAGDDTLNGGAGSDTVSYSDVVSDSVTASLLDNQGSSGTDTDTFVDIENLTGGGGADTLIGDGKDNILTGGDGDDTLIGGAAVNGDTLIGGAGVDTASYAGSVDAVSASLSSGTGSGGDATGDTYSGIENLTGGSGDD
ncbi:MAG: calcium-binding protein, partial [Desulfuromonadales bacterium]|nr:calcium-binding protein [Desulfuromonadales bacterium]NIS43147.1 calcium-binding protein [Desulfuromonadales bacterium]